MNENLDVVEFFLRGVSGSMTFDVLHRHFRIWSIREGDIVMVERNRTVRVNFGHKEHEGPELWFQLEAEVGITKDGKLLYDEQEYSPGDLVELRDPEGHSFRFGRVQLIE